MDVNEFVKIKKIFFYYFFLGGGGGGGGGQGVDVNAELKCF